MSDLRYQGHLGGFTFQHVQANTVFGALHGLESFSQLLEPCSQLKSDSAAASASLDQAEGSVDIPSPLGSQEAVPFSADNEVSLWNIRVDEEALHMAADEGDAEEDFEAAETAESEEELGKHKKKHKKKKKKKHHKKHKKHHKKGKRLYSLNATSIWDAPRFAHRGLLIDTARNFLPVAVILVSQ